MKRLLASTTLGLALLHLTTALPNPSPAPAPQYPTTPPPEPDTPLLSWTLTPTNTTLQFRGLSPISATTTWISGTNASVFLTVDSGLTWLNVSPTLSDPNENSTSFQFRDIHAWSERHAAILSIGEGNLSRIYVTGDAGRTWERTFVNEDPAAFYDCFAFEGAHGVAMSDPVGGKFVLLETWDFGRSWKLVAKEQSPKAKEGEFGFAASGTCVEVREHRWWVATGGVDPGRVLSGKGPDGPDGKGKWKWSAANSSLAGGPAAGVFSVRFRDAKHGVAVGGDFEKPTGNVDVAAWSKDGGRSWVKSSTFPGGYRSGAAWVDVKGKGRWRNAVVAVGTSGSDVSFDGGRNWKGISNTSFDAVECVGKGVCWASGARGQVGKLVFGDY